MVQKNCFIAKFVIIIGLYDYKNVFYTFTKVQHFILLKVFEVLLFFVCIYDLQIFHLGFCYNFNLFFA